MNTSKTIAVIGLGYVGLPLAIEFAKKYPTIGFDINTKRIKELSEAVDTTLEVDSEELSSILSPSLIGLQKSSLGFFPTIDVMDISDATIFIITVPTPTEILIYPSLLS